MTTQCSEKWRPEVLEKLELADLQMGFTCYPWETTPSEYLQFAREDMGSDCVRSRINAIGHAKRAIHSHVEFLLYNCGRCLRRSSFPEKLDLLRKLGIIAPSILTKYNNLRNIIEHEYHTPTQKEAKEVIDVAGLFLEATRCYVRPLPDALVFSTPDKSSACTIDCRWDEGQIILVGSGPAIGAAGAYVVEAESDSELWLEWVARVLRVIQDVDNPYVRCEDENSAASGVGPRPRR